jgi:hypothetical protein
MFRVQEVQGLQTGWAAAQARIEFCSKVQLIGFGGIRGGHAEINIKTAVGMFLR